MAKEKNTYRKKRGRAEIRRTIVAELKMKDYTYREIQAEVMKRLDLKTYGLKTVHTDVQALLEEWRKERIENTNDAVELMLKRNSCIRQEAQEMWEKSKEDYVKRKNKKAGRFLGKNGNGQNAIDTDKIEESKEEIRAKGDPRYLEIMQKANQEEAKLLGLYAPEKIEHDGEITFASLLKESSWIGREE
nr:MAG TPA: hypothetical protein [Caudoviricetes sp.]